MDKKKHSSSEPRPSKPPARRRDPDEGTGDDAQWNKLTDSDLVELSEFAEELDPSILLDADTPDSPAAPAPPVLPGPSHIPDLPAPVGPTPTQTARKPAGKTAPTDLLAPVGPVPRRNLPDLLAPVGPTPTRKPVATTGSPEVARPESRPPAPTPPASARSAIPTRPPAPTPPASARSAIPTRPPAPTPPAGARSAIPTRPPAPIPPSNTPTEELDLPAPVGPLPTRHLPDLLAPVGPTSERGPDLPAPKGFFDDGVQPKASPTAGLPAPKGFFDDGVQPKMGGDRAESEQEPPELELSLELTESPSRARVLVPPLGEVEEDPAELLTLDLAEPEPVKSSAGVNRPFGLDAAALDLERADSAMPAPLPLELNDVPPSAGSGPMPRSRTSRMEIGLMPAGDPVLTPTATDFQAPSVITFGKSSTIPPPAAPAAEEPRGATPPGAADPFAPTRMAGHLLTTEIKLELDPKQDSGTAKLPASVLPKRAPVMPAADTAKRKARPDSQRRTLLVAATLVGAALTVGGYVTWTWWHGHRTREARTASGLRQVERLLADDAPSHWEQAASEARRVTKQAGSEQNLEALAAVAEASFAAALDESPQASERIKEGDQALGSLRARSGKGPHESKAEALRAILSTNFGDATKRLEELKRTAPGDGNTLLYLGWALAAQERHGAAVQSFVGALADNKKRIPALYGLGLSQLEVGDKEAATTSFQAVIEQSRDRFKRDHLGALIGLAQLTPVNERESRYQELLARADLATAPAREVSRLRALAGDEALRAGRLDQGRTRYEEARALDPLNLRAEIGLALVAARSGDIAGARAKLTGEVLAAAPDHIEGALALIEVALAGKKTEEAMQLAQLLFARRPAIANQVLLGRAHLARGRVYAQSPDAEVQARAETEFREAMSRADPGDFAATVGLSLLLTRFGRKQEAVEMLGPARTAARSDPGLALALGSAYLAAGQPAAAVESFRRVIELRPDDAEARFQLANAYLALGKSDDAIDSLRRSYEADPSREDIGLGLARTLEASGRQNDAVAVYQKMLGGDRKPSLTVRAQAGRTFARLGLAAEVAAQSEAIRQQDPRNATGFFLLGEKLYHDGKYEEALEAYRESTELEAEAQFLEGLGRANEKLGKYDDALKSYGDAVAADPSSLAPRLGRGRVRLARREYVQAVAELEEAQKVAPQNAAVLRDLGRAHLAMHDLRQAMPLLERAAVLDDRNAEVHYALGSIYYDVERASLSAQHLARAVELASPNMPWRAEAFRLLGYAQRAAGNRSGAISAWRRYLGIEVKDSPERRDVERLLMRLEAR